MFRFLIFWTSRFWLFTCMWTSNIIFLLFCPIFSLFGKVDFDHLLVHGQAIKFQSVFCSVFSFFGLVDFEHLLVRGQAIKFSCSVFSFFGQVDFDHLLVHGQTIKFLCCSILFSHFFPTSLCVSGGLCFVIVVYPKHDDDDLVFYIHFNINI